MAEYGEIAGEVDESGQVSIAEVGQPAPIAEDSAQSVDSPASSSPDSGDGKGGDAAKSGSVPSVAAPTSPFMFNDRDYQEAEKRWGIGKEQVAAFGDRVRFNDFVASLEQELLSKLQERGMLKGADAPMPAPAPNGTMHASGQLPNGQQVPVNASWEYELKLNPDEWEPSHLEQIAGLNKHFGTKLGAMAQELSQFSVLRGEIDSLKNELNQSRVASERSQFDEWKASKGEAYAEQLGKGRFHEMDGRSREAKQCNEVMRRAEMLRGYYVQNTGAAPPMSALLDEAFASAFPQKVQTIAAKTVSEKSKARTFSQRPNSAPLPKSVDEDALRKKFAEGFAALQSGS